MTLAALKTIFRAVAQALAMEVLLVGIVWRLARNELKIAVATLVQVLRRAAGYRDDRRPSRVVNPATGARELTPEGHERLSRALQCAADRIALGLYLQYKLLGLALVYSQARVLLLKIRRNLAGDLA